MQEQFKDNTSFDIIKARGPVIAVSDLMQRSVE